MNRMILIVLLAPGLLVTKTTVLGPAHCCHPHASDEHRPHWHWNDEHRSFGWIRDLQQDTGREWTQLVRTTEHDDDAIFADDDVFGVRRSNAKNEVIDVPVQWLTQCDLSAGYGAPAPDDVSFWAHPPPHGSPAGAPTFLRHQAILI